MTDPSGSEPGSGCTSTIVVLGGFLLLAVAGAVLFFSGDPGAIPFWRRWALGATLPVSGLLAALGARGLAWTLDLLVLAGVSAWAARPGDLAGVRRRAGFALGSFVVLGAVTASL